MEKEYPPDRDYKDDKICGCRKDNIQFVCENVVDRICFLVCTLFCLVCLVIMLHNINEIANYDARLVKSVESIYYGRSYRRSHYHLNDDY